MAKTLQLLRNVGTTYESYAAALVGLKAKLIATGSNALADGSPILARYSETVEEGGQQVTKERTLLGIKSASGYEIFDNVGPNDAIKALDFAWPSAGQQGAHVNNKPIVDITETDGVIAPSQGSINAEFVNIADAGELITADTVEGALQELAGEINANAVSSADNTILMGTGASGDTDLSVNIDGSTITKVASGVDMGKISTNLQVYKLTADEISALTDADKTNIKDAYQLQVTGETKGTAFGQLIKVYKDSSLVEVYLGSDQDTINADTGAINKVSVTDPQSMNFAYQLANGKYSLTKIDVSKFLTDSEFSDGLVVSGAGVVSVKIDSSSASSKVRVADAPESGTDTGLVDVLSVSSAGVKVDNIQAAINYAVSKLDVSDTAVDGKYVSTVSETDGKISVTRENISGAVLNNYSKGSSSEAVASTDTINQAISKLENQIANVSAASATVVAEGTDAGNNMSIDTTTDQIDGHKTYTINLTDVASAAALSNEITRAGNAETAIDSVVGLTKDNNSETRTYTNTGTYIGKETTNTVKSDIKALDTEVANGLNSVTGSNAITVGTKSNKDQTISLKLDSTTATTDQTLTGTNALQITSGGLFLSSTWDCGTY